MTKIKIGIIGMGRMGITHYSIINTHPDVKIVSIADTTKMILNVIKKYIPEIQVFNDYKELIDQSSPDAIIVTTPPNLHYRIIKYAYEKGIHVFCEKPFTAKYNEAKELVELFKNSTLINQVGYANRERDVFNDVKSLLDKKIIGDVYFYNAQMTSCAITKKTSDDDSWRDKKNYGGGVIYEMASHLIDMTLFFFGNPSSANGTFTKSIFSQNVEDILFSTFSYDNRLGGTIYVNWSDASYRKPSMVFEILGENGKIVCDFYGYKIFLNNDNKENNLHSGWNTFNLTDIYKPVPFYVRGNEFTLELYRFVNLITGKEKNNLSDFSKALEVHKVIELLNYDIQLNKNGSNR